MRVSSQLAWTETYAGEEVAIQGAGILGLRLGSFLFRLWYDGEISNWAGVHMGTLAGQFRARDRLP